MFALRLGGIAQRDISKYESTLWNFGELLFNPIKFQNPKVCFRLFANKYKPPKQLREIEGKKIVYVGGFGSIGFAACQSIAGAGAQSIMILEPQESDKLKQLQTKYPDVCFKFMKFDLRSDKEEIEKILQKCDKCIDGMDVLVNGGGVLMDNNPKMTIDINLKGLMTTTMAAIPLMKCSGGGLILNVAAVMGLEACAFAAVYAATKHAIIGFTRCCADPHYLEETRVAHAAICPGFTISPMIQSYDDVTTFNFSKDIANNIKKNVLKQSAGDCGRHILTVIESAENGSAWISDLGKTYPVQFCEYWKPKYQ